MGACQRASVPSIAVVLASAACVTSGSRPSDTANRGITASTSATQPTDSLLAIPATASRTIGPGEEHVYTVSLRSGERVRFAIEPRVPVLWVRVYSPDRRWVGERIFSPGASTDTILPLLAERDGRHRLVVSEPAPGVPAGSYELRVERVAQETAAVEHERLAAATDWLRRNSHRLHSVTPNAPYTDMMPLKELLAGVRVTAIGEATHGTREFRQLGHRFTEFLVREMGYTIFALETSQIGARAINEYVLHGIGDHAAALAGQGEALWDTQEFTSLIEWMRAHNRTAPAGKRVQFVGFDFQYNPGSRERIVAYLERVAPGRAAAADTLLAPLTDAVDSSRPTYIRYYALPPESRPPLLAGVRELLAFLEQNRPEFVDRTSSAAFDSVHTAVHLLVQFADTHNRPGFEQDKPESGVATRDRYLAENILGLLRTAGPHARILVYTHNQHARRDPYSMGYYLGEALSDAYYAFGTSFNRGTLQALEIGRESPPPRRRFTLGPAFQQSVGWYMERARVGDLFVSFRHAAMDANATGWLAQPLAMRSIGNGYAPGNPSGYYRAPVTLGRSFDGIVFVERTTPVRPNSVGPR